MDAVSNALKQCNIADTVSNPYEHRYKRQKTQAMLKSWQRLEILRFHQTRCADRTASGAGEKFVLIKADRPSWVPISNKRICHSAILS